MAFQSLQRHEKYYISSADLSILVERIQFKVHRYFFERESGYFSRQLATPASPGSQPLGTTDSTAIILENVTAEQFSRFLWVFYNPRYSLYDEATCDDWQSILQLAHMWLFPEVKRLAIRELERQVMLDVKRIKLYHETEVNRNLLIPRYAALCEREESLTLEEGMDLGMATTLMIAKGREEARSSRSANGARSPLSAKIHGDDLHEVIRELFKISPSDESDESSPETTTTAPAITTAAPTAQNTGALPMKKTQTPTKPTSVPRINTQETAPPAAQQKQAKTQRGSQATKPTPVKEDTTEAPAPPPKTAIPTPTVQPIPQPLADSKVSKDDKITAATTTTTATEPTKGEGRANLENGTSVAGQHVNKSGGLGDRLKAAMNGGKGASTDAENASNSTAKVVDVKSEGTTAADSSAKVVNGGSTVLSPLVNLEDLSSPTTNGATNPYASKSPLSPSKSTSATTGYFGSSWGGIL